MKRIQVILLSLFLVWGCGGSGDSGESPQAPIASGGALSITWNMSQSSTVEENSNGATLIDATLNNSTAKLSFSLTGTDANKFSISDGYLVFTDTPDYENPSDNNLDNTYALTINASGAGISSSHSFSLNVSNVNEAPSLVTDSSSYFLVNENLTEIKQIAASDPENDTLIFSLQDSSGTEDEGLLQIDSTTGIVSFKTASNYESPNDIDANNTLVFTVSVSDGSFSVSKKYYVEVVDVKENPTDIYLSSNSVAENSSGVTFGTISLVDDDPVGIKTLRISGPDAISFEMGPGLTLKFRDDVSANYETKSTYSITLTIKDADGITLTKSISLSITDVNEIPVISGLSSSISIAENLTSVVTVSASDEEGSNLTYTLTGTDASSLSISSSGVLTFNTAPNYESKSSYSVSVNVSDGTNTTSKALTLTITDVNEAPTDIALSGGSALENSAGVSFGTLSTSDQDSSESFAYSITGGTDAASFEIGTNNTLKFISTVSADYESKNSYSVIVTSTDSGSNTYSETLTVSITNINEAPSFTTSSTTSVAENGTSVVSVAASDPESSSMTYSLGSGNDTAKFSITSAGVLTFNRAPDYEIPTDSDENNTYLVNLVVSDGTNSTALTMTVTVTDVTEATALETPDAVQTVETK